MIAPLPPRYIDALWPQMAALLKPAVERYGHGCYAIDDIRMACLRGEMVAWADLENDEVRAVATTEIHSYPRRRFMCIRFVGGRNMKEWMAPMLEKITDYALHSGCDALTGGGRGGWIKAAGFRDAGVFLMKDLR